MAGIACDKKGTHSLQALIALITTEEEEEVILDHLQPKIPQVAKVNLFISSS